MTLKEMLNLADRIAFEKTGQHLDDLQAAVLRGTLQRETYKQIAKDFDCSESNVRQTGAELWRILSEELGEEVSKSNVRAAMERFQSSNILNFAHNVSGSFNICGEAKHPPDIPNSHSLNREASNQDLSEMPELGAFYDSPNGDSFASRTSELQTLTTWILQQHYRLIAITGISGIGKTTLAVQLVQQIQDEFESVIWCSLDASSTLDELQHRLIEFFSQPETLDSSATSKKPLPLIKYLQKQRCLVILDDIHNLFSRGELAGKYHPDYEEYRVFFKQIEKLSHQSCFVLVGWEQPREIPQAIRSKTSIHTLQLKGLDPTAGREILREYGLAEIDNWETLIHRYQGNPLWLKSVATFIQELGESVTELLPNDTLLLPEDLKDSLQEQLSRLSELEKQSLSLLAKENEPVNLAKLLENATMPSLDLLNALQSLSRRSLIEKESSLYFLSPVLRQYIRGYL
jgi:NB-ARC domain